MLLAGDIGGTKTVLALISEERGVRGPLLESTFRSGDYETFESIVSEFLRDVDIDLVTSASFGVAGPVLQDSARITNLTWVINSRSIMETFDIRRVHLLNDLEAIANAVPILEADDLATINEGKKDPEGAIAVIAPGTGLGQAFMTWSGTSYLAHPTEGGHASFGPNTSEQDALLAYLRPRFGHVSVERVCSGSGIPNIYQFLRDDGRYQEPVWLRDELAASDDATPVIARAAEERRAPICVRTMELFVEILASEASNLALKVLSTGGVYLGGGIPPRLLSQLHSPDFLRTFTRKGRFSSLLAEMPLHVILNPRSALYGTARYGLESS